MEDELDSRMVTFAKNCATHRKSILDQKARMMDAHNSLLYCLVCRLRHPGVGNARAIIHAAERLCRSLVPPDDRWKGLADEVQNVLNAAIDLDDAFIFRGYRTGLLALLAAADLLLIFLSQAEEVARDGVDGKMLLAQTPFSGLARAFRLV